MLVPTVPLAKQVGHGRQQRVCVCNTPHPMHGHVCRDRLGLARSGRSRHACIEAAPEWRHPQCPCPCLLACSGTSPVFVQMCPCVALPCGAASRRAEGGRPAGRVLRGRGEARQARTHARTQAFTHACMHAGSLTVTGAAPAPTLPLALAASTHIMTIWMLAACRLSAPLWSHACMHAWALRTAACMHAWMRQLVRTSCMRQAASTCARTCVPLQADARGVAEVRRAHRRAGHHPGHANHAAESHLCEGKRPLGSCCLAGSMLSAVRVEGR